MSISRPLALAWRAERKAFMYRDRLSGASGELAGRGYFMKQKA